MCRLGCGQVLVFSCQLCAISSLRSAHLALTQLSLLCLLARCAKRPWQTRPFRVHRELRIRPQRQPKTTRSVRPQAQAHPRLRCRLRHLLLLWRLTAQTRLAQLKVNPS